MYLSFISLILLLIVLLVLSTSFNLKTNKYIFDNSMRMSSEIKLIKQASEEVIKKYGAKSWPTWSCGVSKFPWTYSDQETCLLIKGKVKVTPKNGTPVTIEAGDMAVFPSGMSCEWEVTESLSKHYNFD